MSIPIGNVYWLLCYAWDQLEALDLVDVSTIPETRPADLFARVLAHGVTHVLKRGLDRAYTVREEEIAGIRGRLDVSTSRRRSSGRPSLAPVHGARSTSSRPTRFTTAS